MATLIETPAPGAADADAVRYVSPEGQVFAMSVDELVKLVQQQVLEFGSGLLPSGVRAAYHCGRRTIWVGEFAPAVRPVRWIAPDSPVPYGPGTRYGVYEIALPYVILLGVFEGDMLSGANECFFRTAPLASEDDELFFPALLNVSRIRPSEGRSLAWVCTQHLNRRPIERASGTQPRRAVGWRLLCETLFDASFNLSSEHHEGASWYGESKHIDPRLSTIDAWQAASRENWLFPLDLSYLATGHTLRQIVRRIFTNLNEGRPPGPVTALDLVRLMVNHSTPPPKPR